MTDTSTEYREDNVFIGVYDTALLRYRYPEWDTLSKREKLQLVRRREPRAKTHNVTCTGLHRLLARSIDPEQNVAESVATLALGDDDASGFSSGDSSLNNAVGEIDVTDTVYDDANAELLVSTFIDSSELNGETLRELGLKSDQGRLLNHADLDPDVTKDNSKTVSVDVILGFTA